MSCKGTCKMAFTFPSWVSKSLVIRQLKEGSRLWFSCLNTGREVAIWSILKSEGFQTTPSDMAWTWEMHFSSGIATYGPVESPRASQVDWLLISILTQLCWARKCQNGRNTNIMPVFGNFQKMNVYGLEVTILLKTKDSYFVKMNFGSI